MMTTLLDNQKEHWLPAEYGTEIFRCQVGSGVHGVTVGNQDDRDEMGICIEKPNYVIGLDKFEQWEYRTQPTGHRSGYGDLDLTVYSLRKWMRLALDGNPTIILPLFVPKKDIMVSSAHFNFLRENAGRFISQQNAHRFLGYMQAQRQQMLGLRGSKHTNRPELVEIHGYDTKFAYHMLRLGIQGIELLNTGTISLPIRQPQRAELVSVREGGYTKEDVISWAESLEAKLTQLSESSDLPNKPDRAWANEWLKIAYCSNWKFHGYIK